MKQAFKLIVWQVKLCSIVRISRSILRTMVRNEEEKAQIEAIRVRKEESKRKKQEYADDVASRKSRAPAKEG